MTTNFFPFLFLTVGQACRVSVPQREIEPWALAVEVQSPNHWTPGNSL